jgi:hypothetical protein
MMIPFGMGVQKKLEALACCRNHVHSQGAISSRLPTKRCCCAGTDAFPERLITCNVLSWANTSNSQGRNCAACGIRIPRPTNPPPSPHRRARDDPTGALSLGHPDDGAEPVRQHRRIVVYDTDADVRVVIAVRGMVATVRMILAEMACTAATANS